MRKIAKYLSMLCLDIVCLIKETFQLVIFLVIFLAALLQEGVILHRCMNCIVQTNQLSLEFLHPKGFYKGIQDENVSEVIRPFFSSSISRFMLS